MNGEEQKLDAGADRGVSPAIAVLLMAAVTIIIAAVIGAFVLGIGGQTEEPAPVVTAELDREEVTGVGGITSGSERIELSHRAGDSVSLNEIRINTEARCFDNALLTADTKRGELINLPVGGTDGIQEENIQGENIFQEGGSGTEDPLSGSTDTTWESGEALVYHINADKCDVPDTGTVTVQVIHEPSNSIIIEDSLGGEFQPAALEDEIDPATAGDTSTHTFFFDLQKGDFGNPKGDDEEGTQLDKITVDYNPDGMGDSPEFDNMDNSDVTVTMTVSKSSAGGLVRQEQTLIGSPTLDGPEGTVEISGSNNRDVEGPIKIELDGIKNPPSSGTYNIEFTLIGDGRSPTNTILKTIEIEN